MHHPEEAVSSFGPRRGSGGEFAGAEFAAGGRSRGNFPAGNSPPPLRPSPLWITKSVFGRYGPKQCKLQPAFNCLYQ